MAPRRRRVKGEGADAPETVVHISTTESDERYTFDAENLRRISSAFNEMLRKADNSEITLHAPRGLLDKDTMTDFRDWFRDMRRKPGENPDDEGYDPDRRTLKDFTDEGLLKLHLFASYFTISELINATLDQWILIVYTREEFPLYAIPLIYEHTNPEDDLRRFIVDAAASFPRRLRRDADWGTLRNHEAFSDIMHMSFICGRDPAVADLVEWVAMLDICQYHVHADDRRCRTGPTSGAREIIAGRYAAYHKVSKSKPSLGAMEGVVH